MTMDTLSARTGGPAEEPAGPYAITVAFELAKDAHQRFIELVRVNAAASVALEPHCLRFDVLLPAGEGAPDVLLYEIYVDRAAFDHHLATDHFRAFDSATRDMVRHKSVLEFTAIENAKAR